MSCGRRTWCWRGGHRLAATRVLEATKNSTRFRVTLPAEVMDILRWHTDRLPDGPMLESDLLFPSDLGGFRSPTVLDKPFKDVCKHLSRGGSSRSGGKVVGNKVGASEASKVGKLQPAASA